ncbi:hypothetical protein OTB20_42110, partial [Streptomyces sp. H27-H1]|nr:hypothetical protein [Streptomyces sp. H27-H1]
VSYDADLYKERNTVERLINKLKAWRGIATRYDKSPESYLAGVRSGGGPPTARHANMAAGSRKDDIS